VQEALCKILGVVPACTCARRDHLDRLSTSATDGAMGSRRCKGSPSTQSLLHITPDLMTKLCVNSSSIHPPCDLLLL
jgi:hypothetical protein